MGKSSKASTDRISACEVSKSNHRTLAHADCGGPTRAGSIAEPECPNLVWTDLVTETGTVVHVEISQERYRQLELHRGAEIFVRVKDLQVFPQYRNGHQPDQYVERVQGVSATRSK
jgi:hypothetical protein